MNPLDGSGFGDDVKTLWKPVVDPSSGRTYYVNRNTKATVWEKPADADQPWVKADQQEQQLPPGWVQHFDPKKQKPYFHNTNTGETVWKRPMAYELHRCAPELSTYLC